MTPMENRKGQTSMTTNPPMNGTELIAAERQRQISAEGWTRQHDDEHDDASLSRAAACYLDRAARQATGWPIGTWNQRPPENWPWDRSWWKPDTNPVRNLVKAGALIAAEIDRLQRATQP